MIDKENVRNMSRLAMLESKETAEVVKLCRFQKVDYSIVQAVKGCVAGTACFAAGLGLWFCYIWDDVNTFFHDAQYMVFFRKVLGLYLIFMLVYLVICVLVALHRHKECRGIRKEYLHYLRSFRRSYRVKDMYRRRASGSRQGEQTDL